MAVPNPPTPYDGLYVYDVYDAVQGGDPSIPDNPFNLNGELIAYGVPPVITSYLPCAFPSGQNNKIIRYTLTRKNDGNNLVGLTKLATLGNYGGGGGNENDVAIAINGDTLPSKSGTAYREFETTDLTEIAVNLSDYGDPIAFYLPGATLVPIEHGTRSVLYKHTGFTEIVDVIEQQNTPSGPYGTYGTGTTTGNANRSSTLSSKWPTAIRLGQPQVKNSTGRESSPAPGGGGGGGSVEAGEGGKLEWSGCQDLIIVFSIDDEGNRGAQIWKTDKDGNLIKPVSPLIYSPAGLIIGQ